jgi:threonine aldolase
VVASGVSAADYASGFETAWIDFSKGLGAPAGAVLCGSRDLIAEAWRHKQMLGGALRQSGVLTAACMHALDHHVDRLADDHENARALAEGLGLDPATVESNIVIWEVDDAPAAAAAAAREGVEVGALDDRRLRAVTHLNVDRAGVERALAVLGALSTRPRC